MEHSTEDVGDGTSTGRQHDGMNVPSNVPSNTPSNVPSTGRERGGASESTARRNKQGGDEGRDVRTAATRGQGWRAAVDGEIYGGVPSIFSIEFSIESSIECFNGPR